MKMSICRGVGGRVSFSDKVVGGVVDIGRGVGKVGMMGLMGVVVRGAGERGVSKLFMGMGGGFVVVGAMFMMGYCIWANCKDRCDGSEEDGEKLGIFTYEQKRGEIFVTRAVSFSCILSMVIGVVMFLLGYAYGGDGK